MRGRSLQGSTSRCKRTGSADSKQPATDCTRCISCEGPILGLRRRCVLLDIGYQTLLGLLATSTNSSDKNEIIPASVPLFFGLSDRRERRSIASLTRSWNCQGYAAVASDADVLTGMKGRLVYHAWRPYLILRYLERQSARELGSLYTERWIEDEKKTIAVCRAIQAAEGGALPSSSSSTTRTTLNQKPELDAAQNWDIVIPYQP